MGSNKRSGHDDAKRRYQVLVGTRMIAIALRLIVLGSTFAAVALAGGAGVRLL